MSYSWCPHREHSSIIILNRAFTDKLIYVFRLYFGTVIIAK